MRLSLRHRDPAGDIHLEARASPCAHVELALRAAIIVHHRHGRIGSSGKAVPAHVVM